MRMMALQSRGQIYRLNNAGKTEMIKNALALSKYTYGAWRACQTLSCHWGTYMKKQEAIALVPGEKETGNFKCAYIEFLTRLMTVQQRWFTITSQPSCASQCICDFSLIWYTQGQRSILAYKASWLLRDFSDGILALAVQWWAAQTSRNDAAAVPERIYYRVATISNISESERTTEHKRWACGLFGGFVGHQDHHVAFGSSGMQRLYSASLRAFSLAHNAC